MANHKIEGLVTTKLFERYADVQTTVHRGVHRVAKTFRHRTDLSQPQVQAKVATALNRGVMIDVELTERLFKSKSSDRDAAAKEKMRRVANRYGEGTVEFFVIEGISYACSSFEDSKWSFGGNLALIQEVVEHMYAYYGGEADAVDWSSESEDEEGK